MSVLPQWLAGIDGPTYSSSVGVVAPADFALSGELVRWLPEEISCHLARLPYYSDDVGLESATFVSDTSRIEAAARSLHDFVPAVTAYLCTLGSFFEGPAHERTVQNAMATSGSDHLVTTADAIAEAADAVRAERLAVVAPYTEEVTDRFVAYLEARGKSVVSACSFGLTRRIWAVQYRETAERIISADHAQADAIVVACTNLSTIDVLPLLEGAIGKPVIAANQATMWACMRTMGLRIVPGTVLGDLDPVESV
ncbi:maleate cis-trans isomerase family protein [Pseudonocardia phyllosphaerae]|uniref:maleate cis-trans isomerase family protein n=1 Tax=Pseudonocardia phyllosphaerae TaxID=3390502 RepID=UPI00397A705D